MANYGKLTGSVMQCLHCSKDVYVAPYRTSIFKFCSRSCGALHSRERMTSVCAECGNSFDHISSRANRAKYCSSECYYKAMHKKGSVTKQCVHCGTSFQSSPSHHRKYCSRACNNKSSKQSWTATFATVRKQMLRRSLVTKCNRCGYCEFPEILGIHHIDRNRKNNEPSNLEVLCPICHSLEHKKHINHGGSK